MFLEVLINRLNHPFLHNTAWMGAMNINIHTCCFVFESNTRTRSRPFIMNLISEMRQKRNGFFVCKVLGLPLYLDAKVLKLVLTAKLLGDYYRLGCDILRLLHTSLLSGSEIVNQFGDSVIGKYWQHDASRFSFLCHESFELVRFSLVTFKK